MKTKERHARDREIAYYRGRGWSYHAIAREVGCSYNTVRRTIDRLRQECGQIDRDMLVSILWFMLQDSDTIRERLAVIDRLVPLANMMQSAEGGSAVIEAILDAVNKKRE